MRLNEEYGIYSHCQNVYETRPRERYHAPITPMSLITIKSIGVSVAYIFRFYIRFLPLSPSYAVVRYIQYLPTHLPFGDEYLFSTSLLCDLLPGLNLATNISALPGQ